MLPAGYFVYSTYFAKPSDTGAALTGEQTVIEQPVVVQPLNEGLLNDAQVGTFTGKSVAGFAEQQSGIYLDETVPLAPEKITVTNPGTGGRLLVAWQLPVQKNFAKVKVYRSEAVGVIGDEVYAVEVRTSDIRMNFSDHSLVNQKIYYYHVVTENAKGAVSQNNEQYPGTPSDTFPPAAPLNVTVINVADSQVKISWIVPLDPDFSAVHIYKSNQRGVLGVLIDPDIQGEKGNGEYALDAVTPNTPYYYTVTSVDASGNESSTDVMAAPYRSNPFEPSL